MILHCEAKGKVKVKCALVQALRLCTGRTAHRGSRGIAVLYRHWGSVKAVRPIGGVEFYSFLTTTLERGEESASRPGRSLPSGKTRYPLYRRLGGPQGRSGQVWKISSPPGSDPRTVQPVALSLYWLSYPAHTVKLDTVYESSNAGDECTLIFQNTFCWWLSVRWQFQCLDVRIFKIFVIWNATPSILLNSHRHFVRRFYFPCPHWCRM